MTNYRQHPLSAAFPAMTDAEFAELRADIAANGLCFPITLHDEQVLDGWHRYRACADSGVEPRFTQFTGSPDEAIPFVISANATRRHLSIAQRAAIADRIADYTHGGKRKGNENQDAKSRLEEAARLLHVSPRTVTAVRAVRRSGNAEMHADVLNGKIGAEKAAHQVTASRPKPAFKPLPPPQECGPVTVKQWRALASEQRSAILRYRNPKARLNREKPGEDDNLIDWARWSLNPITGCLHDCPYCYARDIAQRFHGDPAFPNGFVPTFRPDRLSAPLNQLPSQGDDPREGRIFIGSMSDIFGRWVPPEWIEAILAVAAEAIQWEFLMLTKFPKRIAEFDIPENVWMGATVDCQARVEATEEAFARVRAKVKWLSIEPMIERLRFQRLDLFDLVVIGGASPSSQTPRWIPPFEWVADLKRQADEAGCWVYEKSNLFRKEQPGGERYQLRERAPDVFHYLTRAQPPGSRSRGTP